MRKRQCFQVVNVKYPGIGKAINVRPLGWTVWENLCPTIARRGEGEGERMSTTGIDCTFPSYQLLLEQPGMESL